jgi:hypothetical protein
MKDNFDKQVIRVISAVKVVIEEIAEVDSISFQVIVFNYFSGTLSANKAGVTGFVKRDTDFDVFIGINLGGFGVIFKGDVPESAVGVEQDERSDVRLVINAGSQIANLIFSEQRENLVFYLRLIIFSHTNLTSK